MDVHGGNRVKRLALLKYGKKEKEMPKSTYAANK